MKPIVTEILPHEVEAWLAKPLTDTRANLNRPPRTIRCVAPGCARMFRPSTNYQDFEAHFRKAHGESHE